MEEREEVPSKNLSKGKRQLWFKRLRNIISESIPLNNDAFMIFAKNKDFCQEFLRVVLQDEKLVVVENDIQKYLPDAFSKSVIIDMLCRLGDKSLVNVEIQLTNEDWHARRILHYASKIKSHTTAKGTKYKDIKDLIIIYLTVNDIFKKGSTVYEVDMNVITDHGEIVEKWNSGLKVYYVNAKGLTNKNINDYLKLLTDWTTRSNKYQITNSIKSDLYKIGGRENMSSAMQELFDEIREDGKQEARTEMQELFNEIREDGKREGIEKGIEKGKVNLMIEMVKDKIVSIAEAAKRLGMSEAEFTKLAKA